VFSPKSKVDIVPIEGGAKKQLDPIIDVPFSSHGHNHNGVHTGQSLDKGGFCVLFAWELRIRPEMTRGPRDPETAFQANNG
jgi:hypothetical protein